MKTTFTNRLALIATAILMGLSVVSCSSEDEPLMTNDNQKVSEAQVTFTYTIPEDMFKYAEITACYNNNEGTDAEWVPMLDNTFKLTYTLDKFPVTAPLVFVYDTTNRPAYGVDVDWAITMDVEVTMTIDGKTVTKTDKNTFNIDGDLGAAIHEMQNNVLERTYAVKLDKYGDVVFEH